MYLGIDVGGTKVAAALVGESGSTADRLREAVDQSTDTSATEQLKRIIQSFDHQQLDGVGIGVPGIADQKRKTVWAPNIRGWDHFPLQAALKQSTNLPLTIESDRNTAILGEMLFGAARGKSDAMFLILGTGIGAGIVCSGCLLRGAHDIGGAVGWIPVHFRGQAAHFEEIAAGPGIEKIARQAGLEMTLPELAEQARAGHHTARNIFEAVGDVLGQSLSALVSTFNPEIIILGGGVSQTWDLMCEAAKRSLQRWSQPVAVEQVEVVVTRLGEDAGILGAAAAASMAARSAEPQP